jgi:polyhydroxybutyrate depolymerase
MRSGHAVIGVVLGVVALPGLLAGVEAVSFHVRNRSNGVLMSSGLEREYLLHVPQGLDRTRRAPLVVSLHGGAMWPAAQMETSRWNRLADALGFIVVYPSAVAGRGPRAWDADGGPGQARDVRYISDLIDTLMVRFEIDSTRIYANGLSNGGGMTFALSCELSDRIAAFGMVAPALFLPWSGCAGRPPAPLIVFHGTSDPAVPYRGGRSWVAPNSLPDIGRWVARFAERNRCTAGPADSAVAPDVSRRTFSGCADDATVVLYTIAGGGHTWPGGGPLPEWFVGTTSHSVDASRLMWEFFVDHPRRSDGR